MATFKKFKTKDNGMVEYRQDGNTATVRFGKTFFKGGVTAPEEIVFSLPDGSDFQELVSVRAERPGVSAEEKEAKAAAKAEAKAARDAERSAAREARKAERETERAAREAERTAAREARAAEREAARAAREAEGQSAEM